MKNITQLYLNRLNGLWFDTSLPPERKFNGMIFMLEVATYTLGPEKIAAIAKDADLPFTIDDYKSIVDSNAIGDFETYQPIIFYMERIAGAEDASATERLDILSFATSIISDLIPPEDVYFVLTEANIDLFYKNNIDLFQVYPHVGVIPKILTPIKVD